MTANIVRRQKLKTTYLWRLSGPVGTSRVIRRLRARGGSSFLNNRAKTLDKATWSQFLGLFERLTDSIVASAKNGVDDALELEYQAVKISINRNYHRIAHGLRPFLTRQFSRRETFQPRPISKNRCILRKLDRLQELLRHRSMEELLSKDGGMLITHMSSLSEAVYQCEQQRRLYTKTK